MATRRRAVLSSFFLFLCLACAVGHASAYCDGLGWAIFQCAERAYVAPSPVPVSFDPNGHPTNVSTVFWQIGFGNRTIDHFPSATTGTGMTGSSTFNGNDSGPGPFNVRDARMAVGSALVPEGALCLSTASWGNVTMDGCADNDREPSMPFSHDGFLNSYIDLYAYYSGYPGTYTLDAQQDYPMALLMKAPAEVFPCDTTAVCDQSTLTCASGPLAGSWCNSNYWCGFCSGGPRMNKWCSQREQCADDSRARYFAYAAVASLRRGNTGDGQNGPCHPTSPGTNPAPCDYNTGWYELDDISNGLANPVTGRFDVIPWQQPPAPVLTCTSGCGASGTKTVDVSWPAVTLYHDSSVRPSTNPKMGPADPTRAPGVGVLDVASLFPIVRYQVETATATCAAIGPNGRVRPEMLSWSAGIAETPTTSIANVTVPPDTCFRVRTLFGKKPETAAISVANCRVGKCGDLGYDAVRDDPDAVDCTAGAIIGGAGGTGTVAVDADGDGAFNCGQDCNDADPAVFATPGLVDVENVEESPSGAVRYSWADQSATAGPGTHYDVYSGSAYSLAGVGDFTLGSCFADNLTTPHLDVNPPSMQPNEYLYFLVRAQNGCASSTSGFGAGGRDSGAASSASPCD
jgi:hypothetical protein